MHDALDVLARKVSLPENLDRGDMACSNKNKNTYNKSIMEYCIVEYLDCLPKIFKAGSLFLQDNFAVLVRHSHT